MYFSQSEKEFTSDFSLSSSFENLESELYDLKHHAIDQRGKEETWNQNRNIDEKLLHDHDLRAWENLANQQKSKKAVNQTRKMEMKTFQRNTITVRKTDR